MNTKLLILSALGIYSFSFAELLWNASNDLNANWFPYQSTNAEATYTKNTDKLLIQYKYASAKSSDYAGVGFNYDKDGKTQALTGKTGVCVTYRAPKPVRLNLEQTTITDSDFFGSLLPATNDFESVLIPFSSLKQEGWGSKKTWNLNNHKSIHFDFKLANTTKADSSNTFEILEFGFDDVCGKDASIFPEKGTSLEITTKPFFDGSVQKSDTNTFGGKFSTYATESSTISPNTNELATYVSENQAIGFNASLKGVGYPTAGIKMHFTADSALTDLSDKSGLCVVYQSASGARVQVLQKDPEISGYDYYGFDLQPSSIYSLAVIPFDSLKQEHWGYATVLDLSRVYSLQFEGKGVAGDSRDLKILQIGFGSTCSVPTYKPVVKDPYNTLTEFTLYEGDSLVYDFTEIFEDLDSKELLYKITLSDTSVISKTINSTSLKIKPLANTNAEITLTIKVADEKAQTAEYNATINIIDRENAPVAQNLTYTMEEGDTLIIPIDSILAKASDADADEISFVSYEEAFLGNVSLDTVSNALVYIATDNITELSKKDFFKYEIQDDSGLTAEGIINIEILRKNRAPVITLDSMYIDTTVSEDFGTITFKKQTITSWFTDEENDTLTYSVENLSKKVTATLTTGGYLNIKAVKDSNGIAKLQVLATDNKAEDHTAIVEIRINITPVNDKPIAKKDTTTLLASEFELISYNLDTLFTDPDNDSLTYEITFNHSALTAEIAENELIVKPIDETLPAGLYKVIVKATDPEGLFVTNTLVLKLTKDSAEEDPSSLKKVFFKNISWAEALNQNAKIKAYDLSGKLLFEKMGPISPSDLKNALPRNLNPVILKINKNAWIMKNK